MSKKEEKSTRYVLTIPEWMHQELKELAAFNRRTMAEEVRIAIEDRLEDVKRTRKDTPSSEAVPLAVG